jgi:hypothetical protein
MNSAIEPSSNPPTPPSFWQRIGPALSAALVVSWVLILQEIVSDFLPLIGSTVLLPIWMFIYYLQGLLVGWFSRQDPRTQDRSPWGIAGLGSISALWTGLVMSGIVSLVSFAVQFVITAGAAVFTLPLTLGGTILDLILNMFFTSLGAWLYAKRNGRQLGQISCLVGISTLMVYCLVLTILIAFGIAGGFSALQPYLKR